MHVMEGFVHGAGLSPACTVLKDVVVVARKGKILIVVTSRCSCFVFSKIMTTRYGDISK